MPRGSALLAALLALTTALTSAACGSAATDPQVVATADLSPATPTKLVGSWNVDAPGVEPTVIAFSADGFRLWRGCGETGGEWAATHDGWLVTDLRSASGSSTCRLPDRGPTWLANAASASIDGEARVLRSRDGTEVARLEPINLSSPRPTVVPSDADPLDHDLEPPFDATVTPPALPSGTTPATSATLVGRWQREGAKYSVADGGANASFNAAGSWGGTDGCNGQGGQWAVGAGGSFVATTGLQTMMGCAQASESFSSELGQASRAGFEGEVLVLRGDDGTELVRLVRV